MSSRRNTEEYSASSYGGFADYMRRKKIKLTNQDRELLESDQQLRAADAQLTPIFAGTAIFVNGYTNPSREEIRRIVVLRGGKWLPYLDQKTGVTHIIASNLTIKKQQEFRNYKVVRPDWITDSVREQRLLPWSKYRLVSPEKGQPSLLDTGSSSNLITTIARNGEMSNTNNISKSIQIHDSTDSKSSADDSTDSKSTGISSSTDKYQRKLTRAFRIHSGLSINPKKPENVRPTHSSVITAYDESDRTSDNEDSAANIGERLHESVDERQTQSPEEFNEKLLKNPHIWKSSVLNPDFLKSYYENSRLHHLSTWKADLKLRMSQMSKKLQRDTDKTDVNKDSSVVIDGDISRDTARSSERFILHVDFDSFFASIALRSRPELSGRPVVVCHSRGSTAEIASCNYEARKFGVTNGSALGCAKKLCPELTVLPYEFEQYEDASSKFYEILSAVDSDQVHAISIDEALLDVTSLVRRNCKAMQGRTSVPLSVSGTVLQQSAIDVVECALRLAEDIRAKVREETGVSVSVGISSNILLARIALRKAKPDGTHFLRAEHAAEEMSDLDVQELPGIGFRLSKRLLERFSVSTIGELLKVSQTALQSFFGAKLGKKLWSAARGIDIAQVGDYPPRKTVSVEVNWGVRFFRHEQVMTFLASVCKELERRLEQLGFDAASLSVKLMVRGANTPYKTWKHLGHGVVDVFSKSATLPRRSHAASDLLQVAIELVDSFQISPGNFRGVGLSATKLSSLNDESIESVSANAATEKHAARGIMEAFLSAGSKLQISEQSVGQLAESVTERTDGRASTVVQPKKTSKLLQQQQDTLTQSRWVNLAFDEKNRFIDSSQYGKIDREVLYELPVSERREIMRSIERSANLKRLREKLINYRNDSSSAISRVFDRTFRSYRTIEWPVQKRPQLQFQGRSKFEDVLQLVHEWVLSAAAMGPHEVDVEILDRYLRLLVRNNESIDQAGALVRLIVTLVAMGGFESQWRQSVAALSDAVTAEYLLKGYGLWDRPAVLDLWQNQ